MDTLEVVCRLEGSHAELAEAAVRLLASREPGAPAEPARRDLLLHLRHLNESFATEEPRLFRDYRSWFTRTAVHHGGTAEGVRHGFEALRGVLAERLPGAALFLAESFDERPLVHADLDEAFPGSGRLGELAHAFLEAALLGERLRASRMILDAADEEGCDVRDLYLRVFQPVLRETGRLWETNRIGVAEEHLCTTATRLVMSQLAPRVLSPAKNGGVAVLASVSGELHDVGLRMVADFLEMEGWATFYVGASVPPESLVAMVVDRRAHVLALSATLALHVRRVHETVSRLRARRPSVKVLVGGHPFNVAPSLAHRTGADAYARDARDAVAAAARLIS